MISANLVEPIYGQLPEDWQLTFIGELESKQVANLQTGPFGTMLHASSYVLSGTPVVAVKNIGDNRLLYNDLVYVDEDNRNRLANYLLIEGDIIFGRKGAVDRRAYVKTEEQDWIQGSDCIRLRLDAAQVDSKFVSYVFGSVAYKEWIIRHAQGATMPSLNQSILRRIPIPLPPLPEQRAIAHILGSLDDKIELNRQMNQTLEAIARALFQAWFIDFEPVRAKAAGLSPTSAGPTTAALFPDRLVESELGPAPEGWRVGRLDELILLQRGFDLPEKSRTTGKYPILAASGPSGTHNEYKAKGPGVTTGRSGVIGRAFFVHEDFWPLNTSLWVREFRGSRPIHTYFLLQTLSLETFNAGSAVPTLNRNHIHNLPVIIPQVNVIEAFENLAMPIFKLYKENELQSLTLTELRDTLLPKLISGQVRVGEKDEG